jgi:ABC-type amino acid transport substrate-binding protein
MEEAAQTSAKERGRWLDGSEALSMRTVTVSIMSLMVVIPASAAPVTLVDNGMPTATIVVEEEADPKVVAGAADLQRYIEAICGVELPINADGREVDGTALYIGECEPTLQTDLPEQGLNPEAYAIRVRQGDIYLTGRWPTPVRSAVASFIEDDLGVRWFAPGELWEDVPEGTDGELMVLIAERLGLEVVPQMMEWSAEIQSTKQGKVDIMHGAMG